MKEKILPFKKKERYSGSIETGGHDNEGASEGSASVGNGEGIGSGPGEAAPGRAADGSVLLDCPLSMGIVNVNALCGDADYWAFAAELLRREEKRS